jgi:hypothetical protein
VVDVSESQRERFSPRQVAAAKLYLKLARKLGHEPDPRAYVIANAVPVKARLGAGKSATSDGGSERATTVD